MVAMSNLGEIFGGGKVKAAQPGLIVLGKLIVILLWLENTRRVK